MNIIDDIIDSLVTQPKRWKALDKWMSFERDDNIVISVHDTRQLSIPNRAHIVLSWWQKRRLNKALHQWQTRPLEKQNDAS